MAIDETLAAPN